MRALGELLFKALLLLHRIVQLAERVAQLEPAGKDFEALNVVRVVGLLLRERRDDGRVIVDEGGLDKVGLDDSFEQSRRLPFRAPVLYDVELESALKTADQIDSRAVIQSLDSDASSFRAVLAFAPEFLVSGA